MLTAVNRARWKEGKKKSSKTLTRVNGQEELIHIKKKTVLPYSGEHCLVGNQLRRVFVKHLGFPKDYSGISLELVTPRCFFQQDFFLDT